MKFFNRNITFLWFLFGFTKILAQGSPNVIDLSGKWDFAIDSTDIGLQEGWFKDLPSKDSVFLPGSMAENGKGNDVSLNTDWTGNMWNDSLWYRSAKYAQYRQPENIKVSFWLSPKKVYHGPAWYQKPVIVPEKWNNKTIILKLERPHWETTVWIDNHRIGTKNYLGTPHIYDLSNILTPGEHTITIRIDNRVKTINVGKDAHSITDNTQTNWNGIVGEIKLFEKPKIFIDLVKVYPDLENKEIRVRANVKNRTNSKKNIELKLGAELLETSEEIPSKNFVFSLKGDKNFTLTYPMGDNPKKWDEFTPNLYELSIELKSELGKDSKKVSFGMSRFKTEGRHFAINNHAVFLRGTLECAVFPKTGYPPTNEKKWARIFKIIRAHGLNHMRFHSWCPPEAAFIAADKAGVYLQVEASAWTTIGDGKPIDKWLYKEARNILDVYGNHPSFVMMSYGNEPSGKNQAKYLEDFVAYFKNQDSTKVFTGGSGWPLVENADYYVNAKPRIQHWAQGLNSIINSQHPQTDFDYEDIINRISIPYVAHEMGQWCVYPDFKEIQKYTGILKPKNFEIFKETLDNNHIGYLADSLVLASGKLQTLCYKADIEAALRTKGFGGFQLLDLHDFPGQGTALVGVLDAFWDEKGYVSPEEFRSFSGQVVPLALLPNRIFFNNENLEAKIEIANFGNNTLKRVKPHWILKDKENKIFMEGNLPTMNIDIGNGITLGNISIPLSDIEKPSQLNLAITVANFTNSWNIWVFPKKKPRISQHNLKIVKSLDTETVEFLKEGGKVLLNPTKGSIAAGKGGDIAVGFSSIFWNTSWTKGQAPHTLGILCNPNHPALAEFPTEYHSDWQWWDAMTYSDAIVLDDFSPQLKPIVRIIDDWFENRRLALIFEVRIGKGKLLVSGIDLHTDLSNRKEAQQLLFSLKRYMNSEAFAPKNRVDIESIRRIYNKEK